MSTSFTGVADNCSSYVLASASMCYWMGIGIESTPIERLKRVGKPIKEQEIHGPKPTQMDR
ncbi:MAG: hypothetical protein ABI865_14365 [Nitrosospira sp.]